jgi:hypothetical protein
MSTKLTPIDPEKLARLRQSATPQEPRLFEEIASLFLGGPRKMAGINGRGGPY